LCVGINKIIDDKFLESFPKLKYILSPATADDHIKTSNKNIKIIKLIPKEIKKIKASSEFTLLLILMLTRNMNFFFRGKNMPLGEDLCNKTVGLLGYGRIGKNLHRYLKALGCKVIWNDKKGGRSKKFVLNNSDIIIVLVNSIKENVNFINFDDFNEMHKIPFFINITRGFVVNEKSLLDALENKKIKGAALDVVENYSYFKKYLQSYDNLIITPHIAGSTRESRKMACDYVIKKLKEMLDI
jgi:phosphoglycerate dehydrogenase-like enzyme